MEKGGLVWLISSLFVIVLIVVVVIFFSLNSNSNEKIDEKIDEKIGVNQQVGGEGIASNAIPTSAVISLPFYINAWRLESSMFSFEIVNNGAEEYVVKSLSVEECGVFDEETTIIPGVPQLFEVECDSPIQPGNVLRSDIELVYFKQGSSFEFKSAGIVTDTVYEDQ